MIRSYNHAVATTRGTHQWKHVLVVSVASILLSTQLCSAHKGCIHDQVAIHNPTRCVLVHPECQAVSFQLLSTAKVRHWRHRITCWKAELFTTAPCSPFRSTQEVGKDSRVGLRSTTAAEFEPLRIHFDFSRVETNGGQICEAKVSHVCTRMQLHDDNWRRT